MGFVQRDLSTLQSVTTQETVICRIVYVLAEIRQVILLLQLMWWSCVQCSQYGSLITCGHLLQALPPSSGERVVPIVHTGVPAVKPAEQPIVETPKEVKSES
jgi:hypothetical protein